MTITWELILGVAGGIVVLVNAIKAIGNFISPVTDIKKKVEKHDELLDNDHKRLTSIITIATGLVSNPLIAGLICFGASFGVGGLYDLIHTKK